MPGTELIVPDQGVRPRGPSGAFRRLIRLYVMAGLALTGWMGFLLLAGVLLMGRPGAPVAAKAAIAADAVWILAGPLVVADPWVATAMPIQLGPSVPRGSWIRITGMPALASLSSGHTIGAGAWKVPVAALSTLTVTAPNRDRLRSDISIALMSAAGARLVEVRSVLAVIPPAMCGAVPTSATGQLPDDIAPGTVYRPSTLMPLPVLATHEARRRAEELVLLGEIQRLQGRVASARGYYEKAAKMGSARGAMALAATFDPSEIAETTLQPDRETARTWYRRSRELMGVAVAYHLKRLEQ
jgi:hypothetical protein